MRSWLAGSNLREALKKKAVHSTLGSALAVVGTLQMFAGCSNEITLTSNSSNYSNIAVDKSLTFDFKKMDNVAVQGDVVSVVFMEKDQPLLLLADGTSVSVNLSAGGATESVKAISDTPPPGTVVVSLNRTDHWRITKESVTYTSVKPDGSRGVLNATVNFDADPVLMAVGPSSVLLKVGSAFKLIRDAGKLEFLYDAPLDFRGVAAPLTKFLGCGMIGENGFWVTDGDRRVSIMVKSKDEPPRIVSQRIKVAGASGASFLAFHVKEIDGKLGATGASLAFRKSDGAVLKSDDPAPSASGGGGGGDPQIADGAVLQLVKDNCVGCHGDAASNNFKKSLTEAAWKSSADAIKRHLEANSMPPGGTRLETRMALGDYLKKVAGLDVNFPAATPTPTATATPHPKLAEFNSTYKTLIQNSCVNACHTHAFHLGTEATFERVLLSAVAMKGRLDNNSMPRAPVTITAANRTMLSTWLGGLTQ